MILIKIATAPPADYALPNYHLNLKYKAQVTLALNRNQLTRTARCSIELTQPYDSQSACGNLTAAHSLT